MTRSAQMPLLFRNASKELRVVLLAPRRHPNKTPSHIYKQLTSLEIYQCWWYPRGQGLVRHFAFSFRSFWSLNPVLFQSTIVWERNLLFEHGVIHSLEGKKRRNKHRPWSDRWRWSWSIALHLPTASTFPQSPFLCRKICASVRDIESSWSIVISLSALTSSQIL